MRMTRPIRHESKASTPFHPLRRQAVRNALNGSEPSNNELAAALRQAAEQGRLASWEIRNLVARRIKWARSST